MFCNTKNKALFRGYNRENFLNFLEQPLRGMPAYANSYIKKIFMGAVD